MSPVSEKIQKAAQLHQAGRLEEAVALYQDILRAEPRDWEVQYNMGNALRMLGRFGEGMQAYIMAIRHRPDFAEAHGDLGVALAEIGRWQEAAVALRHALVLNPALTGAYNALGITHKEQGRPAEAVPCFDHALGCHPGQPDAHFARGECLLQIGDWLSGWADYRHRFGIRYLTFNPRRYPQPMWQGEEGQGRTILLWAEQGFGDAIQFCRFAPVLAHHGWRVILEVPQELKRLVATLPGISLVSGHGEPPPAFDVQFPLLDLPGAFDVTPDNMPNGPYLRAAELAGSWRARLDALPGAKIGIVWRGRTTNIRERWRGASAEIFAQFTATPGLSFVSLQRDSRPEELSRLGVQVLDASTGLNDFADTAAMIASLDLVISTDTAGCHLAGSLGVPTWVLLDAGSDWRWLQDRSDSPWYGSMRLFRQPRAGDWASVAAEVKQALAEVSAQT
jgi:tetratricopeptide (TPR) repeat protein